MRLKRYEWIGPKNWGSFVRNGESYKLSQMTDEQVDLLMLKDITYWKDKFRLKAKANKSKSSDESTREK